MRLVELDVVKRRLFTIVLLLFAGASVNVAVAWTLVFALHPSWPDKRLQGVNLYRWENGDQHLWMINEFIRRGRTVLFSSKMFYDSDGPRKQALEKAWVSQHSSLLIGDIPKWSRFHTVPSEDELAAFRTAWHERAFGWPTLCLLYREEHDGQKFDETGKLVNTPRPSVVTHAITLSASMPLIRQPKRLPGLPIWPGFAINTIFYAAMLWVVFFAPGMVKRTLRRRRGLCPACAYPIGSSPVCTECGNPLKIRTCMGLPPAPQATPAPDTERTT